LYNLCTGKSSLSSLAANNKAPRMTFREANVNDIPQLNFVRLSVKENILSNPALITETDYTDYLTTRGKGWVCIIDNRIVGFSIADLQKNNVWALFVQPGYEGKGIGKTLLVMLLYWYFSQTKETIWLGTAPNSRAEQFYRRFGWKETGKQSNGEIRFEMTEQEWEQSKYNIQ
jgi:GNAT superfamily N-acetyltransferase